MSDFDKVEAITKFVINSMSYDKETLNEEKTPEQIRKLWGENLEYALEGHGICTGYAKLANALLHEAGLESYFQIAPEHVLNLVVVDGKPYWLDCTFLDTSLKIDPWTYSFVPDTEYYLTNDLNDWIPNEANYYKFIDAIDSDYAVNVYEQEIKDNFTTPDIAKTKAWNGIKELISEDQGPGATKPMEDKDEVEVEVEEIGTLQPFPTYSFAICARGVGTDDVDYASSNVNHQATIGTKHNGEVPTN